MKRITKVSMVVVVGLVCIALTGCASGPKYSGFLGDKYKNLRPGPEGGARERWLKPGVMFGKYNKFIVDSVTFYFADDSEYKGINPDDLKELSDSFNQTISDAFKGKYPIVTQPGPDVARIRIAITDIRASKPVVGAVSSVVPAGIAISAAKKGAGGSWSGSGATSVEMEALDSLSNDAVLLAVDDKTAKYFERFTSWGSAKEAFKFWADRIIKFIDATRDMK